jgi:hypothetical protein
MAIGAGGPAYAPLLLSMSMKPRVPSPRSSISAASTLAVSVICACDFAARYTASGALSYT